MTALNLDVEMRSRDIGVAELARQAGVSRTAVARIASGESPGRPRTRRLLRAALVEFPPLTELEVGATPSRLAMQAEVHPDPDVAAAHKARLASLGPRDPWGKS